MYVSVQRNARPFLSPYNQSIVIEFSTNRFLQYRNLLMGDRANLLYICCFFLFVGTLFSFILAILVFSGLMVGHEFSSDFACEQLMMASAISAFAFLLGIGLTLGCLAIYFCVGHNEFQNSKMDLPDEPDDKKVAKK